MAMSSADAVKGDPSGFKTMCICLTQNWGFLGLHASLLNVLLVVSKPISNMRLGYSRGVPSKPAPVSSAHAGRSLHGS